MGECQEAEIRQTDVGRKDVAWVLTTGQDEPWSLA